ncbi:hypothetical protein MMA231_00998 [Asticcacaulis sp. MM231]|jgi:hypothetical protein|uniref:hypothetical protein n=1 Tax=Asticcacaulis sp. MM231 TaxID=3157666 RepID=UPI0032D58586
MSRNTAKPWFAPKRYGYGSGLPIAWQGWVVFLAYIVVCAGAASALPLMLDNTALSGWAPLAIISTATIILVIICARKTKGGWRWRWGKDE